MQKLLNLFLIHTINDGDGDDDNDKGDYDCEVLPATTKHLGTVINHPLKKVNKKPSFFSTFHTKTIYKHNWNDSTVHSTSQYSILFTYMYCPTVCGSYYTT